MSLDRRTESERREALERRTENEGTDDNQRNEVRRKVPRRRQIDPTTCERDYSDPEIEFMQAMDDYKRANGRMFPTCSEILEVIQKLGYEKVVSANEVATGETSVPPDSIQTPSVDEDEKELARTQLSSAYDD
jgi:hypothetical protein